MREQEVRELYEAYMQVHQVQEIVEEVEELDEARRDPRGRPASGEMSVYGGRGTPSPDPEGDDNVSRMERAQRRVKRTQPRAKGMAADALNTKYSARQTGRGGENPSPSDRTAQGHPHSPRRGGRSGRGAETDRGSGNAADRRKQALNASYEYDIFDTILEYLVAEGYAETNEAALVIMANMSEEWRQDIMEISQKTATRAYAQSYTGEFEGHDDASDVRRTDSLRGHIERKFGKKAAEDADRHADANTFGRKDPRTGKRQPKPQSRFQNPNRYRTRADGKMHGQDQNKLKAKLQKRSSSDSDNA